MTRTNSGCSNRVIALAVATLLVAACGGSEDKAKPAGAAAAPATTAPPPAAPAAPAPTPPAVVQSEKLPPDGGEVGAAYKELVTAYQALDSARANRLVAHGENEKPEPLDKKDTDRLLGDMLKVHPAGGLRQGDRATLFLDGGTWHGAFSASHVGDHWEFDTSNPSTWEDDPHDPPPNCSKSKLFPCGAANFPDAKVSGSEKVYRSAPNNDLPQASGVLLDGYGVRMLDEKTKQLKYTLVVLSPVAFEPHEFASLHDAVWNPWAGTVLLQVAPDGKSTRLVFANWTAEDEHPQIDASSGVTLDSATPGRLRGHLKFDAKDMAQFDVTFDVGTASECWIKHTRCGLYD